MTAKLSLLITANNQQAKGALKELQQDLRSTATSARGFSAATGAIRSNLGGAAGQMTAVAAATRQVGQATEISAGSVANLMSQFNDIGVMMAAGQNPLQLAIQQGTQITQVLGPMGARGAVTALGRALAAMVNPLSLITLGVIAGGAALTQWAAGALGASREAKEFAEALDTLGSKTEEYSGKLELLQSGMRSMEELRIEQEITRLTAEINKAGNAVYGATPNAFGNATRAAELEKEKAALVEQLEAHRNIRSEYELTTNLQQQQLETAREYFGVRQQYEQRLADEAARGASLLDTLTAQAEVQRVIALHGADSVEASTARVQAERDAFIQQELSAEMATELKEQIIAAWDAANGVASVDMAGNISIAADEAGRLAQNLAISRRSDLQRKIDRANPDFYDPRNENGLTGVIPDGVLPQTEQQKAAARARRRKPRKRGRSGGGSTRKQESAAERMIKRYERELALLRATDPVQKEIIRNRETLATATDAQRTKIEELIRQRYEENRAMELQQKIWGKVENAGRSALEAIISRSGDLKSVIATLAVDLLEVILRGQQLQTINTGGGGGGGLFGGGGGGFLGSLFGGLFGGFREHGGPVEAGRAYIVGEKRPELFVPGTSGRIVPQVGGAGGGGGNVTYFEQHVHGAAGNQEVSQIAREAAQQAISAYNSEVLPGRVQQINDNPRRVG